jgi:hypothetical protein
MYESSEITTISKNSSELADTMMPWMGQYFVCPVVLMWLAAGGKKTGMCSGKLDIMKHGI